MSNEHLYEGKQKTKSIPSSFHTASFAMNQMKLKLKILQLKESVRLVYGWECRKSDSDNPFKYGRIVTGCRRYSYRINRSILTFMHFDIIYVLCATWSQKYILLHRIVLYHNKTSNLHSILYLHYIHFIKLFTLHGLSILDMRMFSIHSKYTLLLYFFFFSCLWQNSGTNAVADKNKWNQLRWLSDHNVEEKKSADKQKLSIYLFTYRIYIGRTHSIACINSNDLRINLIKYIDIFSSCPSPRKQKRRKEKRLNKSLPLKLTSSR